MPKLLKFKSKKAGLTPGSLVYVGEKKSHEVAVNLIEYNKSNIKQDSVTKLDDITKINNKNYVSWLDIDGVHNTGIFKILGEKLGMHSLILEDIVNTDQRPKLEDYETHMFLVAKMIYVNKERQEMVTEQISFVLTENYLISLQEKPGDVFNPIRERLKNQKGKLRNNGTDYLCYALLDAIVDNYFNVLEYIGNQVEKIEEELLFKPSQESLQQIHKLKQNVILLHHSIWPLREVINSMKKSDSDLITDFTTRYINDVYDHCLQVIDSLNTYKDVIGGLLDIYVTNVSNKMNEVMKTLTIIATIFIPLTFLAGIYGMNFHYMPELEFKGAYFILLGVMLLIFIAMIFYFRRKKWL